jgi:hypothetical protein
MLETPQQVSVEKSLLGPDAFEPIAVEEIGEETLNEVLGFGWRVPAPAHKCVDRIPISAAEDLKSGRRLGRGGLSGAKDDAPLSRLERGV